MGIKMYAASLAIAGSLTGIGVAVSPIAAAHPGCGDGGGVTLHWPDGSTKGCANVGGATRSATQGEVRAAGNTGEVFSGLPGSDIRLNGTQGEWRASDIACPDEDTKATPFGGLSVLPDIANVVGIPPYAATTGGNCKS